MQAKLGLYNLYNKTKCVRNALRVLGNFLSVERWVFRRCYRTKTHQNWMSILRKLLTEKDSDIPWPISYIFMLKLFEVRCCWCWLNCWLSLFKLCFHNNYYRICRSIQHRRYMTSSRFQYQTRNDRIQLNVWGSMQDCMVRHNFLQLKFYPVERN